MYKDDVLNTLAEKANVAQFVSFGPDRTQRFSRVFGFAANYKYESVQDAVCALLKASPEKSINVRSFKPDQPQGNEFHYGLVAPEIAMEHILRLTGNGFYVIVNETVDVNDGGVSGVLQGGCMEFAPGVIPRFVEKDSGDPVSSLPKRMGLDLLETVYGFRAALDYPEGVRVEFSIHPKPRGWCHKNTIIWEVEEVDEVAIKPYFEWPNLFSKFLGDKAYGLLMAHLLGAPVPRTTLFSRNPLLGLFTFGISTGSGQVWTRTCPNVQEPGRFSTTHKWVDPYKLMEKDDPQGESLVSCIVQEGVESQFSGALITDRDGHIVIEGVAGFGDMFMQGAAESEPLPLEVITALNKQYEYFAERIGDVRFEWAFDGTQVWVLQLHVGRSVSSSRTIVPGKAALWINFYVGHSLNILREHVRRAVAKKNIGIRVCGNIGLSSHVADILRKAGVPSFVSADDSAFPSDHFD